MREGYTKTEGQKEQKFFIEEDFVREGYTKTEGQKEQKFL